MIPTVTNCAEFIFLPDPSGTSPLLTLADLDHAVPRMSAFHPISAITVVDKMAGRQDQPDLITVDGTRIEMKIHSPQANSRNADPD